MRIESRTAAKVSANGEETRRPLRAISLLPSMATLGNLLCGFFAIFCCVLSIRETYFPAERIRPLNQHFLEYFPTWIAIGVYLIFGSMIFDALDGRLARMARRTSEFGAQLDSIADIVSFGVAPALLYLTLLLPFARVQGGPPEISAIEWRLGLLAALIYVSCAAIRLARYNAENVKDESGQQRFSGLPSPGAAAAFVSLIVLHENWRDAFWAPQLRWFLVVAATALGLLMVSRFNYVHMFNVYVRREHPPIHLIWIVIALVLAWYKPEILLVVGSVGYVISGLILHFIRHRKRPVPVVADDGDDEPR